MLQHNKSRAEIPPRIDFHHSSPLAPWVVRLAPLALTSTPIHLYGATGSGKERFARLLHTLSPQADRPMVAVNCAALSRGTLESELFGHAKGAFTGAAGDHTGVVEQADGGTLFLDEIGELPLSIQAHLLRVLQEGEVRRLGEERVRKVSFRLVSATHRRLSELVEQGEIRADLYHRIAGLTLSLPDLDRRPMDLPRLAVALWREREGQERPFPLSAAELGRLSEREWKGNIRELQNWLCKRSWELRWETEIEEEPPGGAARGGGEAETIRNRCREEEREELFRLLSAARGNKSAVARSLGIPRTTLDYRLKPPRNRSRF